MAALMSTPVMCARPSGVVAAQTKPLRASGFYGNASSLSTSASARGVAGRGALVINMAASKAKKSRDLGMLKGMLEKEETLLVAGFNFQGLRNGEMIKFRRSLPAGAHMVIAKNTLMVKATEGSKWSAIEQCATGMNAWLFVDENIAPAILAVNGMKKVWNKAGIECEFTGAVLDGKWVDVGGIAALEKLPTKKDLIQMVAIGIKQVPTKLARGTRGNASNIAYGVKAIADGESDVISA
mmetsp:Transcript_13072/g.43322  ORF Transcript_13072/g.43322 Transcript_13072/m.43322 type:complete len:239 (+) Transcript_13072:75-791(+)